MALMDYLTAPRFFLIVVARRFVWATIRSIAYPHLILDAIRVALSYYILMQVETNMSTGPESIKILTDEMEKIRGKMRNGGAWYKRNGREDEMEEDFDLQDHIELQLSALERAKEMKDSEWTNHHCW